MLPGFRRLLITLATTCVLGSTALAAQHPSVPDRAASGHDSAAARAHDQPHGGSAAASVATTGGLILLGAAGAQAIRTPTAWPRTVEGFGRRVADQTGFYLLQTGTQRALTAATGWRPDETPCPDRRLLPLTSCAVVRTVTAVDREGARRVGVPFLASVGVATLGSLAWRPERGDAGEARAFLATRLAVVLAGYAGERLLVEWWRGRGT